MPGPEWQRVVVLERRSVNSTVKCTNCGCVFKGGATRIRCHLRGTRDDVVPCSSVPSDVRTFFELEDESKEEVKQVALKRKALDTATAVSSVLKVSR
jgi:hypothetical protein